MDGALSAIAAQNAKVPPSGPSGGRQLLAHDLSIRGGLGMTGAATGTRCQEVT
jgi:hypothetical protein